MMTPARPSLAGEPGADDAIGPAAPALVDPNRLAQLYALVGPSRVAELRTQLLADLDAARQSLELPGSSDDSVRRRAVHNMIAVAGTIGATMLERAARRLHDAMSMAQDGHDGDDISGQTLDVLDLVVRVNQSLIEPLP